MRFSGTKFLPEKKAPAEADTVNHRLLVQAGFVRQLMAGVYTYLPLGLRVLRKIEQVVREEMNAIGGEEILMPMLHPAENWEKTGGWESIDVLFKLKSRTEKDYALGQSQEEVVSPLMAEFIRSYRDLPRAIYHIQWKFRDELRSKSGIMRGREFLMKDMYSFHENMEDFEKYYAGAREAYLKIFKRLGLEAKVTEASGGAFSDKISYEFEVLSEAGEANILYCNKCDWCVNVDDIDKYHEGGKCGSCGEMGLTKSKAAEVGNIFDLGQKYAKAFEITFADKDGNKKMPVMGCYGIGVSRTMGVLVEKFNDSKGIVWPESVAPFKYHLINHNDSITETEKLYKEMVGKGLEVVWDDREVSMGQKFADADLAGIPYRIVISPKSIEAGGYEMKKRNEEKTSIVTNVQLLGN